MPCIHKYLKEYCRRYKEECPSCERMCNSCIDCRRWILQDTADLYDGNRCSRCFDKHLRANGKGVFSKKSSKRGVASDYGCYKNEIQWSPKKRRYTRRSGYTTYDPDYNPRDDYEYDDFCVPDNEVEYEDTKSDEESEEYVDEEYVDEEYVDSDADVEYVRHTTMMDEKYNESDEESEVYEVESIVDYDADNRLWLVKWKDFDFEDSTWEPYENLVSSIVFQRYMYGGAVRVVRK